MSETKGYTDTISTADFEETPRLILEQPTGDVHVEAWDRPEIEVSISDPEGLFEMQREGSKVLVHNRPGSFKLVNFLEPAREELVHQPLPCRSAPWPRDYPDNSTNRMGSVALVAL